MKWVDVHHACDKLGIKRESLYAYVSRGLVRARPSDDDPRASFYALPDIDGLAQRKRASRKRDAIAQGAIGWGDPVLESAITHVKDGRLFYRDQDAITLSHTLSLEEVAAHLWGQDGIPMPTYIANQTLNQNPQAQGFAYLAAAASDEALAQAPACQQASDLLTGLSAALSSQPVALDGKVLSADQRLALAWGLNAAQGHIIRMALVLLADHELNPSTFAARVAASTRASLAACCLAGYATLTGPFHGQAAAQALTFLKAAHRLGPKQAIHTLQSQNGRPFGIGHQLYPDGDPRAQALLAMLKPYPLIKDAIALGEEAGDGAANIDMALAALTLQLDLPDTAPFTLFATARMAGWLAHSREQIELGTPIRPRARYRETKVDFPKNEFC
jgi:citrate synthase